MTFECSVCGEKVDEGNVMVNGDYATTKQIQFLRVVCKPCTRRLDAHRVGDRMHNLWELGWVSECPIHLLAFVLCGLVGINSFKWSKQAVDSFYILVAKAHPELNRGPLDSLLDTAEEENRTATLEE